jgi:predicted nucleic acid-binding protein
MRPSPAQPVWNWARSHHPRELGTTAVTVAEIPYGMERLREGRRKEVLRAAAAEIFEMFAEQVLPFDYAAAGQYALVVSQRDALGLPIDGFDAHCGDLPCPRGGFGHP